MDSGCKNLHSKPVFDRMLTSLAVLYDGVFQCKDGYMTTQRWWPRENNRTADRLCNIALDVEQDLHFEHTALLARLDGHYCMHCKCT